LDVVVTPLDVDVTPPRTAGFRPRSLDAVNFLLADVRGALGPYLNVFLVTQQHWSQSEVGLVTTISGLLGLSVQTPIGAAIDETHAKRGAVVLALALLALERFHADWNRCHAKIGGSNRSPGTIHEAPVA
jgi:hypothetical protein